MEPRILIADDEKSILDTLSDFMKDQGYRADLAETVDSALALMQTNRYEIPEEEIARILRTVGTRIDQLFGMQKGFEEIIERQSEALKKIEGYADHLKEGIPKESPHHALIQRIIEQSRSPGLTGNP